MNTKGPVRRITQRLRAGLALAGAALLASCAQPPQPAGSATRVYAIDLTGAARQCTVPRVALTPGKVTPVTMHVGNDGGWCAIPVALDGQPYAAGLLTAPAAHGRVYVHPVGDNTRVDYTPDSGFAGPDSFTVTLLPGRPILRVAVTVVR